MKRENAHPSCREHYDLIRSIKTYLRSKDVVCRDNGIEKMDHDFLFHLSGNSLKSVIFRARPDLVAVDSKSRELFYIDAKTDFTRDDRGFSIEAISVCNAINEYSGTRIPTIYCCQFVRNGKGTFGWKPSDLRDLDRIEYCVVFPDKLQEHQPDHEQFIESILPQIKIRRRCTPRDGSGDSLFSLNMSGLKNWRTSLDDHIDDIRKGVLVYDWPDMPMEEAIPF